MKKITGMFIVVLISIGIADLIQGVILTLIYMPNSYSISSLEMTNFLQYIISAVTVTIAFWSIYKVKNILKNNKSSVKVS